MRFTLDEIAGATGGVLTGAGGGVDPDPVATGAATDSRLIMPGEMFVAVVAERDGHDFVAAAFEAGASVALVSRVPDERTGPLIVVDDTVSALGRLARSARARLDAKVAAVTGSSGKTTTKDLLAQVLGRSRPTARSPLSHNNELGVPLAVVNAPEESRALVLEMGARARGHVADLCVIGEPDIGVVTNVGEAHLATFGDLDGVARAKSELIAALPAHGAAVLNSADPRVAAMAGISAAPVWRFGPVPSPGSGPAPDVAYDSVALDADLRPRMRLHTPFGRIEVVLAMRGLHQVANAAAAAAAALAMGSDLDSVSDGLSTAITGPWRMDVRRGPSGALVINDSYNANPGSMEAALHTLAAAPARRRVAVLGPMLELGEQSPAAHGRIASLARAAGIEIVAVATDWYGTGDAVSVVDGASAVPGHLGDLAEGDVVLVKASRAAGLEAVALELAGSGPDPGGRSW